MTNRLKYIETLKGVYIDKDYDHLIRKYNLIVFIYDLIFYTPATFFSDGKIQCPERRNRSLTDIYCICKTYFNDISVRSVFSAIKQILFCKTDEVPIGETKSIFCGDVRGMVLYNIKNHNYSFGSITRVDPTMTLSEVVSNTKHGTYDFIRISKCYEEVDIDVKRFKRVVLKYKKGN